MDDWDLQVDNTSSVVLKTLSAPFSPLLSHRDFGRSTRFYPLVYSLEPLLRCSSHRDRGVHCLILEPSSGSYWLKDQARIDHHAPALGVGLWRFVLSHSAA